MRTNSVRVCALVLASALVLSLPLASPAAAQSGLGKLSGQVLNGLTGQGVPGATVVIEALDLETTTDLNGVYTLQAGEGSYTVLVCKEGYQAQKVNGVGIAPDSIENLAVVLVPLDGEATEGAAAFSEGITVETEAQAASEAALLVERKTAGLISDSIGSQEMSKTTGGDAAGVLKRVTGVSLQEGKFVYVRGLGDRYSNTTLNGSKIPSTEFEKKVVPLNLFPAGLLEKISVSKSYTADKPGDFAAGFVDLRTVEFPNTQQGRLGYSTGYNSITTGEPILEYDGGLGFFGDGGQALPASIPADPIFPDSPFTDDGFSRDEIETFGEALVGTWSPQEGSGAPYDQTYKLSYGNTFDRAGLIVSATHENDYETRAEERNIFSLSGGEITPQNTYDIAYGEETVRDSVAGNLAFRFSGNDHVKLRTLYTNLSSSESRFQEGFFSDVDSNLRDYRLSYQDQEIINGQLSGEHYLPGTLARLDLAEGSLFEWRLAATTATTEENRRETNYEERREGEYVLTDNAQSGFMYFNDLEDTLYDGGADWTTFLSTHRVHGSVKAGLAYTKNEREFDGRRLRFDHRSTFGLDLTLPPEELFTEETIGPNFELEEITRPTDAYDGDHETTAAYAQVDLAWGRWRLVGGVRAESSDIEVITANRQFVDAGADVTTVSDDDVLPAFNLVYQLSADTNLRFAASQTVNRPEFRELAPFTFVHIVGGYEVSGNPELESATIRSFDVRWEWFPAASEVVAASIFYKDFDKPIELIQLAGAQRLETFDNADGAVNWGAELEVRRNLGSLWEGLERFDTTFNYTWVDSEIEIDPEATALTNPTRPLAGQPDQVANVMIDWSAPEWGTSLRLLANYVGEKVSRGGTLGLPDVLEEDRTTVDMVWRQDLDRFLQGLSLKLSGTNLTDEERVWSQGGGIFRRYDPGRSYGLSLSYELF